MLEALAQLVILFTVIIDPLSSFAVFTTSTSSMTAAEKKRTALYAVLAAAVMSYAVLLVGEPLLRLFSVSISDFKIAGGIILAIFGVQMTIGQSMSNGGIKQGSSVPAVAAIIATPLLTGPAAITAIIAAVHDSGMLVTGIAITIVLGITAVMFSLPTRMVNRIGKTPIQFVSVIMGMITLAWGIRFIKDGLGF
jgi:multiple antibiotic resistance protein